MAANLEFLRLSVLEWARMNGVLVDTVDVASGGDASIIPFPDEAGDYFRTRKIARVLADEEQDEITIFSRLPIAFAKKKTLQKSFADKFSDGGFKLRVDESKPFKIDHAVDSYGQFVPIHRTPDNALCCGSSLGLGNQRNAGTLTALARKKGDKASLYGISCNHVTGGCSTARPGTPVVIPGIQDVSSEHAEITVIGLHDSTARMSQGLPSVSDISQNRDLAYFEIKDPKLVSSKQGSGDGTYDTPKSFAEGHRGMAVKKWGRSTGLTFGEISSVNVKGEGIEYNLISHYGPMNSQTFKGTIYYPKVYEVSTSGSAPFSLGGDSGSLVVTDDGKVEKIVGIVIGGDRSKSLILPLKETLKDLELTLVSGHNIPK